MARAVYRHRGGTAGSKDQRVDDHRAGVEGLREVLCGPSAPLRILGEHVEQHTGVRQGSQRHGSGFTAG